MNLSPAAMSRTLTRIREAIGDPILVRAGRGLVPTPKALELREQVRDVVEQAARLFRSADVVELGSLRRRFSIRANDFFVGVYGGKLFDTLERQAPHCELRFAPEGDGDDEALREGSHRSERQQHPAVDPGSEGAEFVLHPICRLGARGSPAARSRNHRRTFCWLFLYQHVPSRDRSRADRYRAQRLGAGAAGSGDCAKFHAAMFALPDSDLILPVPRETLLSVRRLGLKLRSFNLPIPLPTIDADPGLAPALRQ